MKPAPRFTLAPFPPDSDHDAADRIILDFGQDVAKAALFFIFLASLAGIFAAFH